jgi:prophage maintenance system killer protein
LITTSSKLEKLILGTDLLGVSYIIVTIRYCGCPPISSRFQTGHKNEFQIVERISTQMTESATFTVDMISYPLYQLYCLQGDLVGYQDLRRVLLQALKGYDQATFMKKIVKASLSKSIHKGKFLGFKVGGVHLQTLNFNDGSLQGREISLVIEHEDVALRDLRLIVGQKRDLLLRMTIPDAAKFRLAQDLAWSSDAIEGTTIEKDESRSLLIAGAPDPVGEDKIELSNHFHAIQTLVFPMANKRLQDIDENYMKALHRAIDIVRMTLHNKGQYRTTNVTIRDRPNPEFADHVDVPRLCVEMFRQLHTMGDQDPVYVASWFHFQFVQIHPFVDGNGRVGRMLMNTVLIQKDFPLACIQPGVRDIYFYSLVASRRNERQYQLAGKLPEGHDTPYDLLVRILTESLLRSLDISLYYGSH